MKKIKKQIGERIYIRLLETNDASQMYADWLNDKDVNTFLETRKSSVPDVKEYVTQKLTDERACLMGIFDKNTDTHIGNVKLEIFEDNNLRADYGILIGNTDYWGKGLGLEATKLVLNVAFKELDLESVELGIIEQNNRARKTFERAGFTQIKKIENYSNHGGKTYDCILMEVNKKNNN
jgi:[ribosomal protein S5]-alanine N-acetyltransferase